MDLNFFEELKMKAKQWTITRAKYANKKKKNDQNKPQQNVIKVYIPPIIIDNVTFSTVDATSEKQIPKIQKKLLKIYNNEYLQFCGSQKLSVENVKQQHFTKIIRTTQKTYNYIKNKSLLSIFSQQMSQLFQRTPQRQNHFWSIDFCRLKVMNLSKHNLFSIEGLTFMQLPHLVCLELHTNNLTSIDCLSKVSFPHLHTLTLYKNKLKKGEKLDRGNLPQLKNIEVDTQRQNCNDKIESLQFVFKLKTERFKKLYAQDENRILSEKFYRKLAIKCLKYPKDLIHFSMVQNKYSCGLRVERNSYVWKENNFDFNDGYLD